MQILERMSLEIVTKRGWKLEHHHRRRHRQINTILGGVFPKVRGLVLAFCESLS